MAIWERDYMRRRRTEAEGDAESNGGTRSNWKWLSITGVLIAIVVFRLAGRDDERQTPRASDKSKSHAGVRQPKSREAIGEKLPKVVAPDVVTEPPPADLSKVAFSTIVEINSATFEELNRLPGIGHVTAKALIENRPYRSVEDLMKIPRMSERRLDKFRSLVRCVPPE